MICLFALLTMIVLVSGCVSSGAFITISLGELSQHPEKYLNKTVTIAGRSWDAFSEDGKSYWTITDNQEYTFIIQPFIEKNRKARTARNPRTGAAVNVPAMKVPKFRAGKGLKDTVK